MWVLDLLELIPPIRYFIRRFLERNMKATVEPMHVEHMHTTLDPAIQVEPLVRDGKQFITIGTVFDLRLINHRTDRMERIVGYSIELKRRYWLFWSKTIISIKRDADSPLENLELSPQSAPVVVPIKYYQSHLVAQKPSRVKLLLKLNMVGPMRKYMLTLKRVKLDWKQPLSTVRGSEVISQAQTIISLLEEDSHIKELLDFYEEQKSNHRDYIHIDLLHVDCSQIEAATPHLTLKISFRNYLPVHLKILKIEESKGNVGPHILPRLSLDREYTISKCGETTHEFILEIQGTDIPRHIKEAAQLNKAMEWVFAGWWKAEAFGEVRNILVPSKKLTWTGIPNFKI